MSHLILITGANGQVGRSILDQADQFEYFTLLGMDREKLDICRKDQIHWVLNENNVAAVINCAAYTQVDKAESDSARAFEVNEQGAANIASACGDHQIPCIHLSSDYVYHSGSGVPFTENAPTLPQGVYAHSKLAGERAVLKAHPAATVIRSSWIYSPYGQNFVKTMLRLGKEHRTLKVVIDQIGTPTYAADLASAILEILSKMLISGQTTGKGEIYNYSNQGMCSWYYFARCIFEFAQMPVEVIPVSSEEFPRPAPRPAWSVMSLDKIIGDFGLEVPEWKYSVKRCLSLIADHQSSI